MLHGPDGGEVGEFRLYRIHHKILASNSVFLKLKVGRRPFMGGYFYCCRVHNAHIVKGRFGLRSGI